MSTDATTARQRLEERVTHCERLADTLNGVVADLQTRMLALEALNRKLLADVREQREAQRALGQQEERPPHY
jgi:uncharacterized coiled-coil protein SlyX